MSSRRLTAAVAAALAVAVVLRWAVILRFYRDVPLGFTDNFWYHTVANLLADGRGFINPFVVDSGVEAPTAAHPPMYPLYLAAWSLLGADSALWHRLASGLVSAAAVLPAAALARRLAGDRAAVIAALAVALHPPLWMNDGLILSESLYIPMAALTLWLAHRAADEPSTRRVAALAAVLAAGALTRSEALALAVVLLVGLVLSRPGLGAARRVQLLAIAAGVVAVLLAPWAGRNLATFDEPTMLSAGAGYVLELGNCDHTYSGRLLGYWSIDCDRGDWPEGDESVVGARKLAIARDYILDHAGEAPKVAAARVGRLFGLFRPLQTADFDVFFERRVQGHVRLGLWLHWAALAPAALGALSLRRRGQTLWPSAAMIAVAAATAAASFGITRYRVGADVAIVVLASVGIASLLDRPARQPASRAGRLPDRPARQPASRAASLPDRPARQPASRAGRLPDLLRRAAARAAGGP